MTRLIFVVIASFFISQSWAGEMFECQSGTGQYTDRLSLELANNTIVGFLYFSTAGAYSCEVRANRGDKETKWNIRGETTTIGFEKGLGHAVIEKNINTYTVKFVDLPHAFFCGMNGQLAAEIAISRNSKKCKIK